MNFKQAFIEAAIRRHKSVWLFYVDAKGRQSMRNVGPDKVVTGKHGPLLQAECEVLYEDRQFYLDRIQQVAWAQPEHMQRLQRNTQ